MKHLIKSIPVIGTFAQRVCPPKEFSGTDSYWETRYAKGGDSGSGSHGQLAEFKAKVINTFVKEQHINSVIEFGCGDGNQLALAAYPNYIGLDISRTALLKCLNRFQNDKTKSFYLYDSRVFADNARLFRSELALSLDVIYHLVEDQLYLQYMNHLFESAIRFVVIYSSNFDARQNHHERRRRFTDWIHNQRREWQLLQTIKNPYPNDRKHVESTSLSDFYIYGNSL